MRQFLVVFALWVFVSTSAGLRTVVAGDAPTLDEGKVRQAVEKGVAWLKSKQQANGSWDDAYFPVGATGKGGGSHPGKGFANLYEAGNSMTAACLAAVILLKATLESDPVYKKQYRDRVNRSIRDGAAYLAHNWTLDHHEHPYYYLYGLERVGVLTGCHRFGEDHYWYAEGGEQLLSMQNDDGSWSNDEPVPQGGFNTPANALPRTCFAVLFLVKGTVPLIPDIPERPRTGEKK